MISQNYWPIVGITFLAMLINTVANSVHFGVAVSIFTYPVIMGLMLYYVGFSEGRTVGIADVFAKGFDGRYYLRRVGGYAWMLLFTLLWSCLLVIPGIVKAYSYSLTPYILAKYPDIDAKEALKLSMKYMDGRKADLFVLNLSFIGWILLSSLTVGLLAVFYVLPYFMITQTLWYKDVMQQLTDSGEFVYGGNEF